MSQEKRLFRNLHLIGNFTNETIKLGNIYRIDDGDFVLVAHLTDYDSSINISSVTDEGTASDRKIYNASDVAINTKAKATSPIGDDEVELIFNKANSGIIFMKNAVTYSLRYGAIKTKILDIWEAQGFSKHPRKFCLCNQIIQGESGTVMVSYEAKNRVVLQHNGPVPIASASVLLDGKFTMELNTKRTNEVISPNPFIPVFQALRIKANDKIDIVG